MLRPNWLFIRLERTLKQESFRETIETEKHMHKGIALNRFSGYFLINPIYVDLIRNKDNKEYVLFLVKKHLLVQLIQIESIDGLLVLHGWNLQFKF